MYGKAFKCNARVAREDVRGGGITSISTEWQEERMEI